jgi:cell fate (sporulation/competence/biofilm development) regulator YlbF (YheA/YmcA/DUF963 family)
MKTEEMMKKMTTSCRVLNDVLRDSKKYDELKRKYQELEKNGKMHKMNDLYDLCEEFVK